MWVGGNNHPAPDMRPIFKKNWRNIYYACVEWRVTSGNESCTLRLQYNVTVPGGLSQIMLIIFGKYIYIYIYIIYIYIYIRYISRYIYIYIYIRYISRYISRYLSIYIYLYISIYL